MWFFSSKFSLEPSSHFSLEDVPHGYGQVADPSHIHAHLKWDFLQLPRREDFSLEIFALKLM